MLTTIPARLQEQAKVRPDAPAYHEKQDGKWVTTTWAGYASTIRQAARALLSYGFAPGETTCILGFNRSEWCIFDHATMAAGGAPAGIYTTSSPDEVAYIVNHAESRVILVENAAQLAKVVAKLDQLPKLEAIVLMRGADATHPKSLTWQQFLAKGESVPEADVHARLASLKPDQLATLIYTSGTTGQPKGVMLSHDNLAFTAEQVKHVVRVGPDDCVLSYLPLSHIAEQVFSLHGPACFGYAAWFAESMEKLPDNLKEVRPTIFFGVPRVWEKFYSGIAGKLAVATGAKAKLAAWALGVGGRRALHMNAGRPVPLALAVQYRLADKAILSKVRAAIGLDRAHMCMSGAAPIGADVLQFLGKIGLTVLEVYGQSEGTGPSTVTRYGSIIPGTVGPAFPGVEVKIAPDDEILVRGRNIFLGYFKEPAATAETLVDGWLHSGDLGSLDAKGVLTITGRKKELIITAGGKNIAPKMIEAALKEEPLIAEAVLIGDRRRFLSALLVLDPARAETFLKSKGLPTDSPHTSPELRAELQRIVEAANVRFAQVEHVRKFHVLPRPLSMEAGELTPTLKLKRKKIAEGWAKEIEAMYA